MARPSLNPETYRRLTTVALVSLVTIMITGAAVRLTNSGLGCPDWPTCQNDSIVAEFEYHAMIEYVNRLFTGVVSLAVIAAVLGSLLRTPRRPDLTRWSLGLVAGVLGQIVLGGLLVLSHLDPRFTMGHFLLSTVLVWNAVVLRDRAGRPDGASLGRHSPLSPEGFLPWIVGLAAAVVVVTGTIVTGAGPHGGDDAAERLNVPVREMARIHSISAILLVGLTIFMWRRARASSDPTTTRATMTLLGVLLAQGAIGYVQYFTGVPVVLVGFHILGAALVWIAAVMTVLAGTEYQLSDRHPPPQASSPVFSKL